MCFKLRVNLKSLTGMQDLKGDTTFMMGSTKKLQAALGRSEEDEQRAGSHKLAPHLSGPSGLVFTNKSRGEIEDIVQNFAHEDYARAGSRATETVRAQCSQARVIHCS